MVTQFLVIAVVVSLLLAWTRSARGRAARELLGRAKFVLLVPPLLWGAVWYLGTADLGEMDRPFLVIESLGFAISGTALLLAALHVTASLIVLVSLARRAGFERASGLRALPGLVLGQVAVWAVMLGLLRLFLEILDADIAVLLLLIAVLAACLTVLNVLLARLVVRLLASGGRLRGSLARLWRAEREEDAPLLRAVLLRLLVTGAIVVIWISGYTNTGTTTTETLSGGTTNVRSTTTTTRHSATKLAVDVQTVATVTCDNPWPRKIAAAVKEETSLEVQRVLDLLTAFASMLFLAGFVAGGRSGRAREGTGERAGA